MFKLTTGLLAIFVVGATGFQGSSLLDAAVIDGYEQARNDRFVENGSFIGEGFDWSGVGMTERGRWGTLIGPNTVISAGHFAPSGSISFYVDSRPGSEPVRRTIASGEGIAETDLWVGCLSEAVPNEVATYAIASDLLTTNNFGSWKHASGEAYIVGRSPNSHTTTQDVAVGKNTIVGFGENDVYNSELGDDVDSLGLIYDRPEYIPGEPNPNYIEFEAHLEVGDSGAPLFVNVDGQLVLLGVNSFITETSSIASHVSYVGNQADAIHTFEQNCLQTIPEPGMGISFLLLGVWVITRKRACRGDSRLG